jgi:hypothetical protein
MNKSFPEPRKLGPSDRLRTIKCLGLGWMLAFAVLIARDEEFDSARISGRVTDQSAKPLSGVSVLVNRSEGAEIDMKSMGPTTTDSNGQYELTLRFAKGQTMVVREMFAEKKGFVRAGPPLNIRLRAGEKAEVSFSLAEGEVLAGMLKLPLVARESKKQLLMVSGPTLTNTVQNARAFHTDTNGHFEMYLPAGEYTVSALAHESEGAVWNNLRAGQRDLVLEPSPFRWTEKEVGVLFDEFWQVMDRQYSFFALKKDVDWNALKEQFRPKATQATNLEQFASVLQEMLAPLRDLHIWIQTPAGVKGTYSSRYAYNGNAKAIEAELEDVRRCGRFVVVGKTKRDGFGYFYMLDQGEADESSVKKAIEAIAQHRDAPGFLVDLRRANGGSEPLASEIASRFCAKETVYAKSMYRSGAAHNAFTPQYERTLPASLNPYTNPVVCLIGPGAVSSGEGFAQMMSCLPNVITVGLPTRGASGNPAPWRSMRAGIAVYFSRWVDLMPDGQVLEGAGVKPSVEVKEPVETYEKEDPTLEKGLEVLREKVGKSNLHQPKAK